MELNPLSLKNNFAPTIMTFSANGSNNRSLDTMVTLLVYIHKQSLNLSQDARSEFLPYNIYHFFVKKRRRRIFTI